MRKGIRTKSGIAIIGLTVVQNTVQPLTGGACAPSVWYNRFTTTESRVLQYEELTLSLSAVCCIQYVEELN